MKRLLILLVVLGLAVPAMAVEGDKRLHAVGSAVAGGVGVMITDIYFKEEKPLKKWLIATGIGLVPGLVKELSDDKFDWEDMQYNLIGAAVGSASVLTITWTW